MLPCKTPRLPALNEAPCFPEASPNPAASTPISRTLASRRKA